GTMNVFDRNINFDALFKFSHISASTQEHLKRVYASFALCMFVAATGAYINVVTRFFQFSFLTGLGALGLMIWLTATPHSRETEQKRLGMLAGFAFLTGRWAPRAAPLSPAGPRAQGRVGGGPQLQTGSSDTALCPSRHQPGAPPGNLAVTGLSPSNVPSPPSQANLYLGLMIMCGFVLFDTQLIIEKAESGDKDYIWHCIDLFLDFVNIFREL
ncbi:BI1 inhibitor, partial [Psophia crepitans]|nr:BI1 inhibitor [Psophia crepitans]